MRRLITTLLFALLSTFGSYLSAAADLPKLDAPPPGLAPTAMQLADLLAAHEKAVGKLAPGLPKTAKEEWVFTDSGMSGTLSLVRSGMNYHSKITTGPFTEAYGQFNGKRWYQNRNGLTSASQEKEEQSFRAERVLEDAGDPKNDAKVIGEVAGPDPSYVVQVKVSHAKHPEWIYYDKTTSLITRVETVEEKYRVVSTYSDFRTTKGMTRAWRITDTYPAPYEYLNDHYTLTALTLGAEIPLSEFYIPGDRRLMFSGTVADSAPLKARVYEDYVIVRVDINGRGLDFELTSGSNGIQIDRQVATELGLSSYGQPLTTSDGKPRGYWTKADLYIGDLQMRDAAIYAQPFSYQFSPETKVVGRLGFDFLKDLALRIDYVHHSVTAMNPAHVGALNDGVTYNMPVRIEDGLPFVRAKIGSAIAERVVFDNALPYTVLFGGFTVGHEDDVKDTGKHEVDELPLSKDDVIGYKVRFTVSQIAHFVFGPADYGQWPVISTNIPYSIGDEEVDAIVGVPFIAYYDVTFDYPHDRIWLTPNEWFFRKFKKNP